MPTALLTPARVAATPLAAARALLPEEGGGDWCPTCGKVHGKRPADPRWQAPVRGIEALGLRMALVYIFRLQLGRVLAHYHLTALPPRKTAAQLLADILRVGQVDLRAWALADAKLLKPAFEAYYSRGANAILGRIGYSPAAPWNVRAPGVQEAMEHHAVRLCRDTAQTTNLAIADAVQAVKDRVAGGLVGEEYTRQTLTDEIGKVFQGAERWRSQRIAVTEASMAIHDGEILAGEQSGVVEGYEPLVSPDACELCQNMAEAFPFVTMEEALAGLGEYAGLTGGRSLPPYHPNCLLGETAVLAPMKRAALVAPYVGPVVTVTLADSTRLTVTPNHMLLTPDGFAAAQSLRQGDYVLRYRGAWRVERAEPDDEERPAPVAQVVRTAAESAGSAAAGVPAAAEDLHGDGRFIHGQVHVVPADGALRRGSDAGGGEDAGDAEFEGRRGKALSACGRDAAAMLLALRPPPDRGVGGRRQPTAFLGRQPAHAQRPGLGSAADRHAERAEAAEHRRSAHAEVLGDALKGYARLVEPAKVADVQIRAFRGHVYDLQTRSTLYIANTVLSSNCQCAVTETLTSEGGA